MIIYTQTCGRKISRVQQKTLKEPYQGLIHKHEQTLPKYEQTVPTLSISKQHQVFEKVLLINLIMDELIKVVETTGLG